MRQIISRGIILSLIISIGIFNQACDKGKVRQLAKAEDNVSQGLFLVSEIVRDAKANGTLSQEDIDFIKPLLKSVGESNKQAIKIGQSLNDLENISADKQAELIAIITFTSTTLTELNENGSLRIKDPQKRIAFSAFVLAMQASVTSVIIILNLGGK